MHCLFIYLLTQTTLNLDFYMPAMSQLFRRPLSTTLPSGCKAILLQSHYSHIIMYVSMQVSTSIETILISHSLQIIACNSLHTDANHALQKLLQILEIRSLQA